MKIFILICCLFVFVSSSFALKNDICGLQHSQNGDKYSACRALFRSWSYKVDSNECVEFVYGGCGGNENRFSSLEECEEMCKE